MSLLSTILLLLLFIFNLVILFFGVREVTVKKNAFGETPFLCWLGIFVWGDTIIFSPYWLLVLIVTLITKNWWLFLIAITSFWLVRSLGETIYWLNQQFSSVSRNHPHQMRGFRFFQNDSIWFIYQIFWQSVTIISLITWLWLARLFLRQ